ncbi:MAG: glutamine amidotransferase [Polyangia bacterium]
MKRAVAIRHVAFEDLGLLEAVLTGRGYAVGYRDAGVDPLEGAAIDAADLLIVLGGPLGANDEASFPFLVDELRLVERRLRAGQPTLGICLGAQLIARVLGARVHAAAEKEIGWRPITLTDAGDASPLGLVGSAAVPVLHWHGDTFELPAGTELLASTAVCPHQAFSIDRTLALQFHLEADPDRFERWLIGHLHELSSLGIDVGALRAATASIAPPQRGRFEAVFHAWLDQIGAAAATEAIHVIGS